MNESIWTEAQGADTVADLAILSDLKRRLQGSREQEAAARAEARALARELAVARRLLRFASANAATATAHPPSPAPPVLAAEETPPPVPPAETPRRRAEPLTAPVIYHLDACENRGEYTAITGWAFRPAPGWDARATTVTLLFRDGATVHAAAAVRVPRPDVAAHFAAQPTDLTGGATGLDGVGFACEILHDSLPAGVELEIALRLDGAGRACEQPTGTTLRF